MFSPAENTTTNTTGNFSYKKEDDTPTDKKTKNRASAPVMRTPEKKQSLSINLDKLKSKDNIPQSENGSQLIGSSEPVMSSAKNSHSKDSEHKEKETKSPRSPRGFNREMLAGLKRHLTFKKEAEPDVEIQKDSGKNSPSKIHRNSAPVVMVRMMEVPTADPRLPALSDELVNLWISAAKDKANKPKLNADSNSSSSAIPQPLSPRSGLNNGVIDSLGRQEYQILKTNCSPELQGMLPNNTSLTVTHDVLIKLLFAESLKNSPVGKTLLSMKRLVMENPLYSSLALSDVMDDRDKKSASIADMKVQAEACAGMTFGLGTPSLAGSKLPAEVIIFWKKADQALMQWVSENPNLSVEQIKEARSNLGFDLIMTRLIYPLVTPQNNQAHLAAPNWFQNAIRLAHLAVWPAFFEDFIKVVDAERASVNILPKDE